MTELDRCWKNCLRMWKWVSKNWKPGMAVDSLKEQWLSDHRFTRSIDSDCFFCEYHVAHGGGSRRYRGGSFCANCPGGYVSKSFSCSNPSYSYGCNPKAFYRKLLQLDAKRRETK